MVGQVEGVRGSAGPRAAPSGSGAALPDDVRRKMEGAFGSDFSEVRIHEGPHVEEIGARAYTQGTDIHFAPGHYDPHSPAGQELLGHELAHVVQQASGDVPVTTEARGVTINDDRSLEQQADELGARAARGAPVHANQEVHGEQSAARASSRPVQRASVVQRQLTEPSQVMGQQASDFREATDLALGGDLLRFDPHAVDLRDGELDQPAKDEHIASASATVSQAALAYLEEAARRENAALGLEAVEMIQQIPDFSTRLPVIKRCLDLGLSVPALMPVVNALCELGVRAPNAGSVEDKCSMLLGMEAALSSAGLAEQAARMAHAACDLCTKHDAVYLQGAMLVDAVQRLYARYPALVIETVTRFCELGYATNETDEEAPARRDNARHMRDAVRQALESPPEDAQRLLERVRALIAEGSASSIGVEGGRAGLVEALEQEPARAIAEVVDGAHALRSSIAARRLATRSRALLQEPTEFTRYESFKVLGSEIDSCGELLDNDKAALARHARYHSKWSLGLQPSIEQFPDLEELAAQRVRDLLEEIRSLDLRPPGGESRATAFEILASVKRAGLEPGYTRTLTVLLLPRIEGLDDGELSEASKNQVGLRARDTLGMSEEDAEQLGGTVTGSAAGLAGIATTRLLFDCDEAAFKHWYLRLRSAPPFEGAPVHASSAAAFVAYALPKDVDANAIIRAFTLLDAAVVRKLAQYLFADPELAGPLLRRLVVLRKFALQESGGNFTTFADFLITLARASSYQLPDGNEQREKLTHITVENTEDYSAGFMEVLLSTPAGELAGKRDELGADLSYEGHYGRTLVFRKGGTYVAVKLRKAGESDDELDNEWKHMAHKQGLGLASLVPTPRAVHKTQLPLEQGYASQIAAPPHPVAIDPAHHCLVYESATKDLWSYINDLDVGAEARRQGTLDATKDLFGLARQGEVDPALTVKNHNVEGGQRRSYEVLIDTMNPPVSRLGAGRLDKIDEMTSFPNVRATGLTDLPDNRFITDLVAEDAPNRDRESGVVHHLQWEAPKTAERLYMARHLADYLFDLTLLIGTAYQKQGLLAPNKVGQHLEALQDELAGVFQTAFATFTGRDPQQVASFLAAALDLPRLAKQLAFYLEPEVYTALLDPTVEWTEYDSGHGTRYEGTHKEPETQQAREELRDLHGTDNVTLSLTYNRDCYIPKDKAQEGQVPGNAHDEHHAHPDLGMVNGSNPLTELERSLYIAAAMMLMV